MFKRPVLKEPHQLAQFFVIYVDLMGQKELLKKVETLPPPSPTPVVSSEYETWFNEAFVPVIRFRETFYDFLEPASESRPFSFPVLPGQDDIAQRMTRVRITVERFSDSLMIWVPLMEDPEHPVPVNSILIALVCVGAAFITMTAQGHVFRGGADIHFGSELYKGELYGQVIHRAFRLEDEQANYPRLLIGDRVRDYLLRRMNSNQTDVFSRLSKSLAQICLDLLSEDTDGKLFLDYLGQGFRQHIAYGGAREFFEKKGVPMAFKFVEEQLNKAKSELNTVLLQKFAPLSSYFRSRMHLWSEVNGRPKAVVS